MAYSVSCIFWAARYWNGISISAASANAASFFDASVFSDMIFVKFTNWRNKKGKQIRQSFHQYKKGEK